MYYIAFEEVDKLKIEQLIQQGFSKMALGYALLTAKYIGKGECLTLHDVATRMILFTLYADVSDFSTSSRMAGTSLNKCCARLGAVVACWASWMPQQ